MREPGRLKAVFLDGYGTLLHAPKPLDRLCDALKRAGADIPTSAVATALKQEMACYREGSHLAKDDATLWQLRMECARVFLESLSHQGVNISLGSTAVIAAFISSFTFELFEDVPAALHELRALGLKLGVISNWDYRLPQILDDLGLGGVLDFVLTSARESAPKPEVAMFRKALLLASVSPDQAWPIGDEVDLDVYPALACGIRSILLDRGGTKGGASAITVRSLTELVALARRELRAA